jgi:hypothetical protein
MDVRYEMGWGVKIPWVGVRYTTDKRFDIPWVGVKIPWVGIYNTTNRVFDIIWVDG